MSLMVGDRSTKNERLLKAAQPVAAARRAVEVFLEVIAQSASGKSNNK